MTLREDFQRARSDREKAARRLEILDAAEALLKERRDNKFAISTIAEKVGVSKSTIFLYFSNREELLATLYARAGDAFFTQFRGKLHAGMSDEAFCEAFIDSGIDNPAVIILRAMMASAMAQSLSQEFIAPAYEEVIHSRAAAATDAEEVLGLEAGRGTALIKAFINLMCGAAQADVLAHIDQEDLPEIVVERVRVIGLRDSFMSGALLVVSGARC